MNTVTPSYLYGIDKKKHMQGHRFVFKIRKTLQQREELLLTSNRLFSQNSSLELSMA